MSAEEKVMYGRKKSVVRKLTIRDLIIDVRRRSTRQKDMRRNNMRQSYVSQKNIEKKNSGNQNNRKTIRKRRRTLRYTKILVAVIVLLIMSLTIKEKFLTHSTGFHLDLADENEEKNTRINLESLYSPYAVLIDLSDNKIIGEHNSQEKIYPASLTKIMTAILAVENTDNLEETVVMPESIYNKLYLEGASMAGFEPGEEVRLKDLLYGVLLPSGAECCVTFAERIAGSEEAFVEMMNQKAQELGMNRTHFCNSTGLQDKNHFSTVEDMAVLLGYALQNDAFRTVFVSERYSTGPTGYHPEGITFHSTMFKELDSAEISGGIILGGKTGYTEEAGLCLASVAEIGGKEYMLVTAGAEGSHDTEPYHVLDAVRVYEEIGGD